MNSLSIKKESIGVGTLLGVSVITPMVYHLLGMRGVIYLPIFLGVIIGSHFLSPISVVSIGLFSPIVNHTLTGMPSIAPLPMLQLLTFEATVLALLAIKMRNSNFNPLIRIILPIFLARLSVILIIPLVHMDFSMWLNNLITGLPGIALNTGISLIVFNYFSSKNS